MKTNSRLVVTDYLIPRPVLARLILAVVLCTFLGAMMLGSYAFAARIQIETAPDDESSRLEFRNITLPDGTTTTLYVVQGSPINISIDQDRIVAEHIEFDLENKMMRIIGEGTFTIEGETVEGRNFSVNLTDNSFDALDVVISTGPVEVSGTDAVRTPGEINIQTGGFSLCSRCAGQENIEDYRFKAKTMRLYPGDRLLAFDVTILVRDAPILGLPVLVLPLGPEEWQPKLLLEQGTLSDRANIGLRWPYVAGQNAFGFVSLDYWADVTPGTGNIFSERFLGGNPDVSYLGAGVTHNFYTDGGKGQFEFYYVPSFIEYDIDTAANTREVTGRKDDEITARLQYDTFDLANLAVGQPQINALVERIDSRKQRLLEYKLDVRTRINSRWVGRAYTQNYIDLRPDDDVRSPSYAGRGLAERTWVDAQLEQQEDYELGLVRVSNILLDLGVFEDEANPDNRSASQQSDTLGNIAAGRLLVRHRIVVEPPEPWAGFSVRFQNDFEGRYYSSQNINRSDTGEESLGEFERLIDWKTTFEIRQSFGSSATLSVVANRDIVEGETPFFFDNLTPRRRTDITSRFELTPFNWFAFEISETYVIEDDRDDEAVGPGPLKTSLKLFRFREPEWLNLEFSNEYDLKEGDPGELKTTLGVRTPSSLAPLRGELTLEYNRDLKVVQDEERFPNHPDEKDTSTSSVEFRLGYQSIFLLTVETGYTYDPDPTERDADGELQVAPWDPLEVTLELGDRNIRDLIPYFKVDYTRDLNRINPERPKDNLQFELVFKPRPIELSLKQEFDYQQQRSYSNHYLRVENIVFIEVDGIDLLDPRWFGIEPDPEARHDFRIAVSNDRGDGSVWGDNAWSVTYKTTYDPQLTTLSGDTGGNRDTSLSVELDVAQANFATGLGDIRFGVTANSEVLFADDALKFTYLRRGALTLNSDWFGLVGIQGALAYTATTTGSAEELVLSDQELGIDDFAVTVRVLPDLYVGALFNDLWNFNPEAEPNESPWNFQPEIYVVWDRCCWALAGSWNTSTGEVSISLTVPADNQVGYTEVIPTSITLPGRGTPNDNQ